MAEIEGTNAIGFNADVDLNGILDEFEGSNEPIESINPNNLVVSKPIDQPQAQDAISSAIQEFEGGIGVRRPVNDANLQAVDGIMSDEEAKQRDATAKLSKELELPPEYLEGELLDSTPEQIRTRDRIPQITKLYPSLAKWSQTPENYVLLNRNVDYLQGVNKAFEGLNQTKLTDIQRAMNKGVLNYRRSMIDVGMALGVVNIDEGKTLLQQLDEQEERNQYVETLPSFIKLQKEASDITAPVSQILQGAQGAYSSIKDRKFKESLPEIQKILSGSANAAGEFWDLLTTLYDDPQAAQVFAVDTLMSSAPSIGAGIVGGAATARLTQSKLAALVGGGASAAAVSFPLEFSARFREELEAFRDPDTGLINYDEAFSDPARVAQWRKEASVFAGVISSSDAFYSMIIGKPFAKLVSKAPGKVGSAVAGAGAEIATGAIEEAASNVTAEVAAQSVSPEGVTVDKLSEKAGDVALEAVGGGVAGGTIGIGVGSARVILDNGKETYSKVKTTISKANKAIERTASLSAGRAKRKEDAMSSQNEEQVSQLIDESTKADIPETDVDIYEDADQVSATEMTQENQRRSSGTIEFSPSRITEYFINQEALSVEEALDGLPSEIMEEYARNRASDTAVSVKVSDWLRVTEEYPEIDAYVRIGGEEITAEEAAAEQLDIEAAPFKLFQKREDGDVDSQPPAIPEDAQNIQEGEPTEVTQLSDITSRFRQEGEREAFKTIERRMRKAAKSAPGISDDAVQIASEIQFRRVMNRAEILGEDANEIAKQLKVSKHTDRGSYGALLVSRGREGGSLSLDITADPSTMIHELGHLWLNDMAADYFFMNKIDFKDMTDAQRAYWESMKLAAEFLGLDNIGDLSNLDDAGFERAQETFAQTTEKYFLDGKFGTSKIRGLMESFRKFLVEIAELVGTAYKQYPALEINESVERMFEGILAPKSRSDETMLPLFPEPMIPLETLDKKAEDYYSDIRASLAQAVAAFQSKISQRSWRERESAIDEILNTAYDEAAEKVNSMPEMLMFTEIEQAYQDYKDLKKAGRKMSDPRISWNTFVEIVGSEEIASRMRPGLRNIVAPKKKGGVDIYLFMWSNDIANDEEMREILNIYSQKDAIIDREAQSIVREAMPVLKSDEDIEHETDEALKDANLSTLFRQELKILATDYLPSLMRTGEIMGKSPESWMRDSTTTEKARELVSGSLYKGFRVKKFRSDYRKHSKEAATFFRQGNMTKAFESKVKSIIAYKAFTQSIDAMKLMERTKKRVKQFRRYSKLLDYAKQFDADVMTFGNQLIAAFESGQRVLPKLFTPDASDPTRVEIPGVSGITLADVARVNQMIDQFDVQSEGRRGNNTSVGAYILFGDMIKTIQGAARRAKKIEIAGKEILIEDARSNVAIEISSSSSIERNYNVEDGLAIKYRANKDQLQTVFSSLYRDESSYVNSVVGYLMAQIDKAQAARNLEYDRLRNRILDSVSKAVKSSRDKGALENYLMPIFRRLPYVSSRQDVVSKESRPIDATKELGITFNNLAEYWMAELMMGSESGAEKLILGGTEKYPGAIGTYNFDTGKIDREPFNRLRERLIEEGTLTEQHFDMMQEIWNTFEQLHPRVKERLRTLEGYYIGKIEGVSFEAFGKTYTGGYVPVAAIQELSTMVDFDKIITGDPADMGIYDLYPSQNLGMAQERKKTFKPIDLNMNRVLLYLSSAVDIIHMREPMQTFGKVFKGDDVTQALENKRPGALKNMILPWFERVNKQRRTEVSSQAMDSLARSLRKNLNRSIYLGNITSAIVQFTGLGTVVLEVGPTNVGSALVEVNKNVKEATRFIQQNSVVMENRLTGNLRRHIDEWDTLINNFDWVQRFDEGVDRLTYVLIQTSQNHVDKITWMAAYRKSIKEGNDHNKAVNFADFTVNATQASSDVSWLNSWQTSRSTTKLLTGIATSFVFSINNVVTRKVARSESQTRAIKMMIGASLLYYGLNQAIDGVVRDAIKSIEADEDDEKNDEDQLEKMVTQSMMGMLGLSMPIVGAIPEGFTYTGRVDFAPALTRLSRSATGSTMAAKRYQQGIPLTQNEMKSVLDTLTIFTGIPASVLGRGKFLEGVLIEGVFNETIDERSRDRRRQLKRLNR
jgi:hypothetical protein